MQKGKHIAVVPGTFDPATLGHFDIIARASNLFDEVIVAVANNPRKHPTFSLEERIHLIEMELQESKLTNVKAVGFSGMIVDFLKEYQATVLVRGLRSITDYDYESQLTGMYKMALPNLEIVMLQTSGNLNFISSTIVRDIIEHRGELDNFLPKSIANYIYETIYQNQ